MRDSGGYGTNANTTTAQFRANIKQLDKIQMPEPVFFGIPAPCDFMFNRITVESPAYRSSLSQSDAFPSESFGSASLQRLVELKCACLSGSFRADIEY